MSRLILILTTSFNFINYQQNSLRNTRIIIKRCSFCFILIQFTSNPHQNFAYFMVFAIINWIDSNSTTVFTVNYSKNLKNKYKFVIHIKTMSFCRERSVQFTLNAKNEQKLDIKLVWFTLSWSREEASFNSFFIGIIRWLIYTIETHITPWYQWLTLVHLMHAYINYRLWLLTLFILNKDSFTLCLLKRLFILIYFTYSISNSRNFDKNVDKIYFW